MNQKDEEQTKVHRVIRTAEQPTGDRQAQEQDRSSHLTVDTERVSLNDDLLRGDCDTDETPRFASVAFDGLQRDNNAAFTGGSSAAAPNTALHFGSVAALCFGMMTHSYLVISVFPYSGFMAMSLVESANEDNAGSYAGLLASSFNFGRVLTAYGWGQVADIYGRTTVLITSLGLSCLLSVLFGLSRNFWVALVVRFLLGMVNGIVATNKTLVSDLAQGNEERESQAMSLVLGMWAWAFLVAPFVSGLLAEPVKQYPNADWDSLRILKHVLEKFPFLLPNVLGAVLCLIAMLLCYCFIEEPLPKEKRRSPWLLLSDTMAYFGRLFKGKRYKTLPVLKEHESDVFQEDDGEPAEAPTEISGDSISIHMANVSMWSLLAQPQTRSCLFVYWGNSFVSMALNEMFPLFCISITAGFGLSERKIGQILSGSGGLFALSQWFVAAFFYNRFGLYGSTRLAAALIAPTIFLLPFSLLLNQGSTTDDGEGHISGLTFAYLCVVLSMNKSLFLVFFSNISVATNRTTSADHRATLNGLSVIGASAAKGLGPSFAGLTATRSVSLLHQFGSLLMFGSLGLVATLVAVLSFGYLRDGQAGQDEDAVSVEMVGMGS